VFLPLIDIRFPSAVRGFSGFKSTLREERARRALLFSKDYEDLKQGKDLERRDSFFEVGLGTLCGRLG